ncbi:Oxygen-regulated protein 1 Retinitis pigmentosa 1 protein Retinitis pigmentosa RP1 protein [Larimichthys crocea]|uniref:Oxygen-regulated protein 1 Retinitis pigmentosa 1 protein Retinitis pigmentosa RP1 protein n=1 Tax=Larimichthys crocea TaxID=215358 RepID=A0A6G0IHF1_LARCR|nr:Oxygen-regulated protein 1 Retinitis pigmentosa 1 protein Retinitis pigmentosa RP1 protein [Larimichthys crocea]
MITNRPRLVTESEQEPDKVQEIDNGVEESVSISQTERDEPLKDKENEQQEQIEEFEEDRERMNDRDANEIDDEGEETETGKKGMEGRGRGRDNDRRKKCMDRRNGKQKREVKIGKLLRKRQRKRRQGMKRERGEELKVLDEDQEATVNDSVETDEREADEVTEEEEKGEDEGDVEADEEENGEETEVKKGEEVEEVNEDIEETGEGEEVDNIEQAVEEEEADAFTEEVEEVEAIEEKEEVEKIIEEMEEEEETDAVTEENVEDEVTAEEEEEEEREMERVTEEDDDEEDVEETNEDKTKVVSEENNEEEDEEEEERGEDGEDVEVKNTEERAITDEEEGGQETDENIEEEENCDEGEPSRKEESLKTENSLEEEVIEEMESAENIKAEQTLDEEEREDDEENEGNELNEGFSQVEERESKHEVEEESAFDDPDSVIVDTGCKNLLDKASYLQQQDSCEEESNVDTKETEHDTESPTKYSSEGQCEDDKATVTDTINELDADQGGEHHEERSSSLSHPVEISQELLDFVNSALQSSSLIFTYDSRGNIRIEPDNARVVQTKQTLISKSRKDSAYGLKCLPSPSTSDLSDYRPETSESGGYKSQDSVDVVTESGEESEKPFPVCRRKTDIPNGRTNVERTNSKLSVASNSEVLQNSRLKSGGSFSSFDSGSKASREDLSYFSAASSQKADAEPAKEATQCISFASEKDSIDGVLIDQGRWLLKENHLIRKSPPLSMGMYDNVDSTSVDTGQENMSEDSPSPCKTQHNPLAAISSSELEEMAKPKCTYFNMPHGSDSDPFLDDSSLKSGKNDTSSVKGRGFRVSPTIDTTKTWPNKNGSLSSFASVEFKVADGKVHPEGESSAVTRPRRTSSGRGAVMQAQDSLDTLHVRCGQYCPIL